MMWTEKNRSRSNRDHLRYPSDVADKEWELIAPLIPSAKRGCGNRRVDMRAVMSGVVDVLTLDASGAISPTACRCAAR